MRCFGINKKDSKYYKDKGITIFPPWVHDFQLFYDYVSALPNFGRKRYSIDRINTKGNYEPGNLRWTDQHIQTININKKSNNTSGYQGVGKLRNKWQATVSSKYVGCADTPEEAVLLRNDYIVRNKLFEYPIQQVK